MTLEDRRILRMTKLRASMKKAGKKLNKEKLIALCCFEWGTTRRTVLEMIKQIELING